MDKLYWIVCEESERTLFEGRFMGRTRGAAMKHLKDQLGRSHLNGLVFTITEIPVPLIREIVAEILGQSDAAGVPEIRPALPPPPVVRFDAYQGEANAANSRSNGSEPQPDDGEPEAEVAASLPEPSIPVGGARPQYDWEAIRTCYMEGRSPKDVARIMGVAANTLKAKITREGWARQRRGQ